ncbi:insulin-like peptide receptor [Watersipora subatra]|uniref:insulin-like peptide receptor n=1 Tax=Watersipora subatra TaxID=2589382 RepID=UPI00355B1540
MGLCTDFLSRNTHTKISPMLLMCSVSIFLLLVCQTAVASTTTITSTPVTQLSRTSAPQQQVQKNLDFFVYEEPPPRLNFTWRNGTVCRGWKKQDFTITIGNQVEDLDKLKDCSVIDGNVEIKWIYSHVSVHNYTNVQYPQLVEITGYLLIYRVNGLLNLGQLFPNLRVIRADVETFWDYGLVLYENENLMSISLNNLNYIGAYVVAMMNPQLCYVDDHVNWNYITPRGKKPTTTQNRPRKNGCDLVDICPAGCENCWDMSTCQDVCTCKGNTGCDTNGKCCHSQCLGGCTQINSARHCYVCQKVSYNGECLSECPERNANGEPLLEMLNRYCVTRAECIFDNKLNKFHENKCVLKCPRSYIEHKNFTKDSPEDDIVRECIECTDSCDKPCGGGIIQAESDSESYYGCTVILGHLEIAVSNAPGNLSLLHKNLKDIVEVEGYVKVVRSQYLSDLSFFKSLTHIGGRTLDSDKYALYVMDNENMEDLWDMETHPNLTIDNGMMFFQQNPQLCVAKIQQLLDTTRFNGERKLKNGTMQKITKSSHDEFDISKTNNGQFGDCFNNSLFLQLFYDMDYYPTYNFSEFHTNDERLVISYVLYYRQVQDNETATYRKRSCQTDEKDWTTNEIEKGEAIDGFFRAFIPRLTPFARYAFYVQTLTLTAVGRDGARSAIIYFKTKPSKPDRPRNLIVSPLDLEMRNIGLKVTWLEPENPYGILENYNIYYRVIPWNVTHVQHKNHCEYDSKSSEEEEEEQIPEQVEPSADSVNGSKCKCEEEEITEDQKERNEKAALRYHFENYLQNKVFEKNPRKTSLDDSVSSRVKRGVKNSFLIDNSGFDLPTTTIMSTLSIMPTLAGNETINKTLPTEEPTVDQHESESQIPSMVSVKANRTSIIIFDLEPNTQYSIEVVACHGYDKTKNVTRCSKRAMASATTKSNQSLDFIDSDTFKIQKVDRDGNLYLNFSWKVPEKTNGPILTYTIAFSMIPSKNSGNTSEQEQFICIQAKVFEQNNNSYLWSAGHLSAGSSYAFRVRMRTVGTPIGEFTEKHELIINNDNNTDVLFMVLPIIAAMVFFAIIIMVVLYRHKRKKPLPLSTLHNSFNIDYVDTENIYIPDEWELDRSKVKIGDSLGQGSFGMVYEGDACDLYNTDKKSRKVAIKTVNDSATIQDRINFLNEASRMKAFCCHHIVQLLGVVSQGQPALVIMELMSLGDLKNYLRMHRPDEPDNDGRKPPTLREILQMAAEIADGMAYLSDRKFVHRDLAARNCMVAHDMTVKIGDFGMTREVYGADYYRKGGKGMLPVRWMAPESLRDGVYTSKSDVWSYGVVLWEMATLAAQPYQGFSNEEVLKFVMDNRVMEMPDGCPTRLFDMMSQCWQYYPRYRPSFANLLESLQGDVKKTFFSVSWYYSQREDDESDMETDSLNMDEEQSESQPLHPASLRSSICSGQRLPDSDSDFPDDIESASNAGKDIMIDQAPPPVPMRISQKARSSELYDLESGAMTNGHGLEDISSTYDQSSPILSNGISHLNAPSNYESPSKASSSIISAGQAPPSYNTATQNQSIGTGPSIWSSDVGSKANSCNGSANGHIHYGNNTLTSAC